MWGVASASEGEPSTQVEGVEQRTDLPPDFSTPTTVREVPLPDTTDGVRVLSETDRKVIEDYAAASGLPAEKAESELNELDSLTAAADELRRSDDGYAGFRIVGHGEKLMGEYATTNSTIRQTDPRISVVTSSLSREDLPRFSDQMSELARQAGMSDTTAVTVDFFDATMIIWSDRLPGPDSSDVPARAEGTGNEIADFRDKVAETEFSAISPMPIRHETAPHATLNRGGMKLYSPNPWYFTWWVPDTECTSGFGASYGNRGADLTAGHCEGGPWKKAVTGLGEFPIPTAWDRSKGGYQDRVFMENTSASYVTYTGTYLNQDMDSVPTHIYLGAYYCHYSRKGYGTRCGYIEKVNVPVTDGFTVFTTQGDAGMKCKGGDSGGPVFAPRLYAPFWPAGTIEAGKFDDTCLYLALDDQMAGSGFSLM